MYTNIIFNLRILFVIFCKISWAYLYNQLYVRNVWPQMLITSTENVLNC